MAQLCCLDVLINYLLYKDRNTLVVEAPGLWTEEDEKNGVMDHGALQNNTGGMGLLNTVEFGQSKPGLSDIQ